MIPSRIMIKEDASFVGCATKELIMIIMVPASFA